MDWFYLGLLVLLFLAVPVGVVRELWPGAKEKERRRKAEADAAYKQWKKEKGFPDG